MSKDVVQKHCVKLLLYPSFSYTKRSGLGRLDCRCDLITQNTFR